MGLITELLDAMRHRKRAKQAIAMYEQDRQEKLAKERRDDDQKAMQQALSVMGSMPDYTSLLNNLRREIGE